MTLVKFCGMTRGDDVAAAAELGVDAVGFVLWPGSPRHVPVSRLAVLVRDLPASTTPVGVFVRPGMDAIRQALDAGIRIVQVHGGPPPAGFTGELWVAAALNRDDIMPAVGDDAIVLLDAYDAERHGGTGTTIDWHRAALVARRRRVVLAGGLTADNVAGAIGIVRPYGVDVASGIEASPGIKDRLAMQRFVEAVREAER